MKSIFIDSDLKAVECNSWLNAGYLGYLLWVALSSGSLSRQPFPLREGLGAGPRVLALLEM